MNVKKDCRYFRGNIPCKFNKKEGKECKSCDRYSTYKDKVLIIKLGAKGDVLRTTCILPKIKGIMPDSFITWVAKSESTQLLKFNPYIDRIWEFENPTTIAKIQFQRWNYVYNLDNKHESSLLASLANSKSKKGFLLSREGVIKATNKASLKWLKMASFDRLKKENSQSYQEIIYDICGLSLPIERPTLAIPTGADKKIKYFLKRFKEENPPKYITIGVNTGAGKRWPKKMWDKSKIVDFIKNISDKIFNFRILLLGGPEEKEKNRKIVSEVQKFPIINTGCSNSLLEFAAFIKNCDILICGDTLASHIATALNITSIVLVGPTSSSEIHSYDELITKVSADNLSCLGCYSNCNKRINCMSSISPEKVMCIVRKKLGQK